MTVSRATASLFTFRSKIEEAVSLVPRMCPEEKLKAVQFWNLVSEKLQDIVNNSAADINAVALKMGEAETEKFSLEMNNPTLDAVPQNNALAADFLNMSSSYGISESGTHINNSHLNADINNPHLNADINNSHLTADINNSHLKQLFPSEVPFTNREEHPSTGEITSIPHIHNLSGVIDMPKNDTQDVCDQLLELANISSNSCDTFTKNTQSLSEIPMTSEQRDTFPSDKMGIEKDCTRHQPSRRAKNRNCDENFYCDIDMVPADFPLVKNQKTSKTSNSKPSPVKNSKLQSKRPESRTICDYLEDSSVSQNHSDFDPADDLEKSNDANSEHIVSFVVSNAEELLENNDLVEYQESSTDAPSSDHSPFTCKVCKKVFSSESSLSSHCWKTHKSFNCPDCSSVFSTKGNLVVHMRKHTGEKPFICVQCQVGFTTQGNLKRHANTHSGAKPWKCEQCNACFTEKKSLTVHMRRHTGERPYQCKVCGKGFAQSGILRTHMAMHLDLKVHLCELCGKSFRQKSQLRMHKLRHDNVRKFSCDSCSALFLTKGDLDRHARKHTGEKPFTCNVCSKTFTRQQSLNEHLNRHYGIKPYVCKHCNKTFAEMSACYKHIKQHPKSSNPGGDLQKDHMDDSNQILEVPEKTTSEPTPEAGNVENELPNIEGQQYYAVVLNSKGSCEGSQSENNQTIVFNSGNEENGFGVLTAINLLTNVSSIPQGF